MPNIKQSERQTNEKMILTDQLLMEDRKGQSEDIQNPTFHLLTCPTGGCEGRTGQYDCFISWRDDGHLTLAILHQIKLIIVWSKTKQYYFIL